MCVKVYGGTKEQVGPCAHTVNFETFFMRLNIFKIIIICLYNIDYSYFGCGYFQSEF